MVTSESALLIIDMQQGLFNGPEAPFAANSILSNISLLITKARLLPSPSFSHAISARMIPLLTSKAR